MHYFTTTIMFGIFIVSIIFSIYLKFPQFRVFKKVREFNKEYPNNTTYKAFLVSLATNLGTGNLIGVTTGIIVGGPGVIIWMWLFGFFSSSLGYLENVYAIKHQEIINGEKRGGACYYILKGLNSPVLSILFACFLLLTNTLFFPPIQVKTIISAVSEVLPISKYLIGGLLIVVILLIVLKGTKQIIEVTNKIVPFMTITFMTTIIFIMIVNYKSLLPSIGKIINSAFNFKTIGVSALINTISIGIRRSLFSHEAGLGSMSSIAGMTDTKDPKIQGYFGILSVYVDTLIMCTITGVVIVQMNFDYSLYDGAALLSEVFKINLGSFGYYLSVFFLFIFAFSSVIGQYYLGESNALLFTKFLKNKTRLITFIYQIIFTIGLFLGVVLDLKGTLSLVDVGLLLLGTTNIIVLILLNKKTKYK